MPRRKGKKENFKKFELPGERSTQSAKLAFNKVRKNKGGEIRCVRRG